MKKRGFTIVELLVSMSIFVILATLAVGAFVSINHFRDLGNNMNESQQKLRLATELMSRLSRQAGGINIPTDGKSMVLTFNPTGLNPTSSDPNNPANYGAKYVTFAKFEITGTTVNYYPEAQCVVYNATAHHCDTLPTFSNPTSLLSGATNSKVTLNSASKFIENTDQIPLTLEIILDGAVNAPGFSADSFLIDTETVLENIGGLN